MVPFWSRGGLKCSLGRPRAARSLGRALQQLLPLARVTEELQFPGSSFTSTGIASYSSLSMLKAPPVPCVEEGWKGGGRGLSEQLCPQLAGIRHHSEHLGRLLGKTASSLRI